MSKFVEFFMFTLMKGNRENIRNLVNIVNLIVYRHLVKKWDLPKRRPADHIKIVINNLLFDALLLSFRIFIDMAKIGRPTKNELEKKVKYGISIDKHLFDKMKKEGVSISKFVQNLVREHYEKKSL